MGDDSARVPVWPLLATLMMQTLATMAAYSLPAAAPEIAPDLGIEPTFVGLFISAVYGVGILSAVGSAGFIRRYGATRVGQYVMLCVLGMLLTAASGQLAAVAFSAVVLGIGYGATAPVATHLLVPRTPKTMLNLIISIRQIGVPLGGVLAGLLVPPLVLALGWQPALLLQLIPALALLLLMQLPRREWDADRQPEHTLRGGSLTAPLRLLRTDAAVRNLSIACFFYAGIQLCFIAFMTVHLTSQVGIDLILAGQALATYQIAGVVSRPVWGWLADHVISARRLLALHGLIMAAAALAAGQFGPDWPVWLVMLICAIAGATASGFTGIAYGEFARQGGASRTEATAVGSAAMFCGVMLLPSSFGLLVGPLGGYALPYAGIAVMASLAAALLLATPARPPAIAN